MKIKFLLIAGTIVLSGIQQQAAAQTVYIPSGTGGIGSSTNTNVGVGTSASPAFKFHVRTNVNNDGLRIEQFGTSGAVLSLNNTGTGGKNYSLFSTGSSNLQGGAGHFMLYDYSANQTRFFVQGGTGNVGIGTFLPDEKLHVYNGSIKLTGTDPVHGAPNIFWGGTPSVAPNGEWALEYSTSDPTKKGMNFWRPFGATGGVGAGNYFLFLGDNGNVGVGSNNPTAKLTVNGKTLIGDPAVVNLATAWSYGLYVQNGILTSKIKVATVNSANWADYVFSPGYQLKSLTEVDQYIRQHQHLPNIPDAAEVEREGIDLVDMNIRLLEKVEELTLYLIQQEKRISELEQLNSDK